MPPKEDGEIWNLQMKMEPLTIEIGLPSNELLTLKRLKELRI
jgi:hypothetical protein